MAEDISVIIPTRNRVAFLEGAIQSVQNQTVPVLEIIVIDDASADDTPQLISRLQAKDSRIKVIRRKNAAGAAAARNAGIAVSRGKWAAFLDDDDIWLRRKLECQLNLLRSNPEAIACTCSFLFIHLASRHKQIYTPPREVTLTQLLCENVTGGASTWVCSLANLQQVGGFDESLQSGQDWDLWIRLLRIGKILTVNKVLVHYYVHPDLRISDNPTARYAGHRQIYFKYRHLMDRNTRRFHIAMLGCYRLHLPGNRRLMNGDTHRFLTATACYYHSRLPDRKVRSRFNDLKSFVTHLSFLIAIRFIKAGFLRIIRWVIKFR